MQILDFIKTGASDPKDLEHVRAPKETDEKLRNYKITNGEAVVS